MSIPNRFNSEVTVEIRTITTETYVHCTDIQQAYLRVQEPQIAFEKACDKLDRSYMRGGSGARVKVFETGSVIIYIYYGKFNNIDEINSARRQWHLNRNIDNQLRLDRIRRDELRRSRRIHRCYR